MQKLRPREVDVLAYPNGAHMTFGSSSPRVRILMFRVLAFMFIVKMISKPHCNHLLVKEHNRHISSQR
jgi:hypothetical protein